MTDPTPPVSVKDLSSAGQRALIRSLKVEISFELHHPYMDPWPSGATDYSAHFSLSWDPERVEKSSSEDARILRQLTPENTFEDSGCLTAKIGWAHLVVGNIYDPSLFEALDAREGDLAHVGGAVLNIGQGSLDPDLLELVDGIGQDLFIVNSVDINSDFRGLSLGAIGVGLSLQHLSTSGSSLAALHPMRPGAAGKERKKAHTGLGRYWKRLGFEPFRDEVYVLDLAMVTLDKKMKKLLGEHK